MSEQPYPLPIPREPLMFVDVEAGRDRAYIWLISVLVEGRPDSFEQFYAETPASERDILNRFLSYRREFGGCVMCHYGGLDESLTLRQVAAHGLDGDGLGGWFDLHDAVKKSGVFPGESRSSLKYVAGILGYEFKHPEMDGPSAHTEYEITIGKRDGATTRRFLEYGEDDVRALQHVVSRLSDDKGIHLDRSWTPPERGLPPSFEGQCALVKSLKRGGASTPAIARMLHAGEKYVRSRCRAEPDKWKGMEVSFEAGHAIRTGIIPDGAGPECDPEGRGEEGTMRGVVAEQVSENAFLVRADGAVFQVHKDHLDGRAHPGTPAP